MPRFLCFYKSAKPEGVGSGDSLDQTVRGDRRRRRVRGAAVVGPARVVGPYGGPAEATKGEGG